MQGSGFPGHGGKALQDPSSYPGVGLPQVWDSTELKVWTISWATIASECSWQVCLPVFTSLNVCCSGQAAGLSEALLGATGETTRMYHDITGDGQNGETQGKDYGNTGL